MTTIPRASGVSGEWVGIGAEKLGLRGEVTPEQFEALRSNHHPLSGEQLTPRTKETRVASTREAGMTFAKSIIGQGVRRKLRLTG